MVNGICFFGQHWEGTFYPPPYVWVCPENVTTREISEMMKCPKLRVYVNIWSHYVYSWEILEGGSLMTR